MILLFSTDAPLAGEMLVALEDTEGIIPPENITPVLRTEVINTYGEDLTNLLDQVTAALTTEILQQMNADASAGLSPAEIATLSPVVPAGGALPIVRPRCHLSGPARTAR